MGIMSRLKGNTTLTLNFNSSSDQKLSILMENQGRINYGEFLEDRKVIAVNNIRYFRMME